MTGIIEEFERFTDPEGGLFDEMFIQRFQPTLLPTPSQSQQKLADDGATDVLSQQQTAPAIEEKTDSVMDGTASIN